MSFCQEQVTPILSDDARFLILQMHKYKVDNFGMEKLGNLRVTFLILI